MTVAASPSNKPVLPSSWASSIFMIEQSWSSSTLRTLRSMGSLVLCWRSIVLNSPTVVTKSTLWVMASPSKVVNASSRDMKLRARSLNKRPKYHSRNLKRDERTEVFKTWMFISIHKLLIWNSWQLELSFYFFFMQKIQIHGTDHTPCPALRQNDYGKQSEHWTKKSANKKVAPVPYMNPLDLLDGKCREVFWLNVTFWLRFIVNLVAKSSTEQTGSGILMPTVKCWIDLSFSYTP